MATLDDPYEVHDHRHTPDGDLLGRIRAPAKVVNLTHGGPRRNPLSITARASLYLATSRAQRP